MAVETGKLASDFELPGLEVLTDLVRKYKENPLTPELINRFWRTFLEISIKTQGLDIPVPTIECDRTQKELDALRKKVSMWVPETKLTYLQLGEIFPNMKNSAVEKDGLIKDEFEQDAKGVDVGVKVNSPNRNTTERDIERFLKEQGRKGMRLSAFILASQASKVLTGEYLDQDGTWSRLLGSSSGDYVFGARFDSDGRLYILWNLPPEYRKPYLGGRSEGVRKVKRKA